MRASRMNLTTLREDPAEAEIASHRLLMRAGYLYKSGAGLYLYAPLMQRVLDKTRRVIAEEISRAGGLEITMPIMQEKSLWEKSGRWATYQASRTMLTVRDRADQEFGLAPTAEEVVTDYAGQVVKSYKQLPVCFFQQHTKFRDEIRPRFGLMRVKEFIMMDAYSFHENDASLAETYDGMRVAYQRTFKRLGLEAFAVEADSGAIGGSGSHEFMVAASVGEDAIVYCPESGYAANVERAEGVIPRAKQWEVATYQWNEKMIGGGHTPQIKSIDELAEFSEKIIPGTNSKNCLKCVMQIAETEGKNISVAAFVRGDRDVNDVKLQNAISRITKRTVLKMRPMHPEEIESATSNGAVGFCGPGLREGISVQPLVSDAHRTMIPINKLKGVLMICDKQVQDEPMITGANVRDFHLFGYRIRVHGPESVHYDDLITIRAGDACPRSGKPLEEKRGIEVGHIFKLGTKYSEAMQAEYLGADQKRHPFVMGCYGIGSSRVVAAAVEQHHDANGMCWPISIAPYQCVIVPVGKPDDHAVNDAAEQLYRALNAAGIDALLDDRDQKPGVKFKDWDLVGIPFRLVCGRGIATGVVEFKGRTDAAPQDIPLVDAANFITERVRSALAAAMSAADAAR